MPFFSSDDRATRIGEVIGSIIAVAIMLGLFVALTLNYLYH